MLSSFCDVSRLSPWLDPLAAQLSVPFEIMSSRMLAALLTLETGGCLHCAQLLHCIGNFTTSFCVPLFAVMFSKQTYEYRLRV